MLTISEPRQMQRWSARERGQGRRIAFVPTMGFLHEGHLELMREGKRRAEALVVSIYVNPTQFNQAEDLAKYPRDLAGDLAKCASVGCDVVYTPSDREMYPPGYRTYVNVEGLTAGLCGASRPGHFRGVATIVTKLFNAVQPDVALFGQKDFQQLAVLARMTRDLDLPVKIVGCPTVREPDGLAMSSRNARLSPAARLQAPCLYRALTHVCESARAGERDGTKLIAEARRIIEAAGPCRVDYLELVDAEELTPVAFLGDRPAQLALAVWIGEVRLIDNLGVWEGKR